MTGRAFAIVGPSGAGKDTLLAGAVQSLPSLHLVRRVITRPSNAGGEDFDGVTEAQFERMRVNGAFALHWAAHGLLYGIPASALDALEAGDTVIFNGSRAMLDHARQVFPGLTVIHVTAAPEVLARRLEARGRETAQDIRQRLERASGLRPVGPDVVEIDNSSDVAKALGQLIALLQPVRA
ncbi:phosphonate metabolism protein/1,5-bisphosphokinase (PRPP-forming) PhnN [Pseudoprimorskyibacter insulae]|uniref:Ribose 1,5-bisphosphate phosphokinase PhnN n=1 Tax=Pseudoprimorskyibacter insulae TaxID=1695997 RepID=A0A2R8AN14_9RHOB|nr:phosphonate metabolism protein/1,5-bisphosphokinase (PRPP-forming) PhnN [Pseudoprimorskyibacter insulae]SPF77433.1 Ribose 1,5-bisphosphate phosphokinase PhnN [Pseudoprimorskyibacter insulae]